MPPPPSKRKNNSASRDNHTGNHPLARTLIKRSSSHLVESGELLSHAWVGNPERSDGMRGDEVLLLGIGTNHGGITGISTWTIDLVA